ncbi:hypothetical protein PINS_up018438, partial [Pythium insidiosum]
QRRKSGHPGAPMGCAPMAHVLFSKVMKFNPKTPSGATATASCSRTATLRAAVQHACTSLVSTLSLDDLKSFRSFGSKCPGHPENFCTPGVEVSTGPLGQGISNAKHLAAEFNRDAFNVVGPLHEGVSSDASSLAGHLGLGKLIVLSSPSTTGNHDHEAINKAIAEAKKETDKPTLIKIRTIIGYGSQGREHARVCTARR